MRKGAHVERLTKKVGQVAATGTVVNIIDGHNVEVRWDDGHSSIISKDGLAVLTDANRPDRTDWTLGVAKSASHTPIALRT